MKGNSSVCYLAIGPQVVGVFDCSQEKFVRSD